MLVEPMTQGSLTSGQLLHRTILQLEYLDESFSTGLIVKFFSNNHIWKQVFIVSWSSATVAKHGFIIGVYVLDLLCSQCIFVHV